MDTLKKKLRDEIDLGPVVWIIGDSIVFWAHRRAKNTGEADLGLGTSVRWLGKRGLRIEGLKFNSSIYINIYIYFLVGFSPATTPGTAHHILLYGCKEPGMIQDKPWDCGEMDMAKDSKKMTAPPCSVGSQILYAWAMDAPPLELPKDIGFGVGGDTGIDYLVLQVHYAHVEKFEDGSTDNSGIALTWTLKPQPFKAGVFFLGSDGEIPGKSKDVHLETACEYEGPTLHPFAYRVHAHKLGQLISGYRIRDEFWTEIGKRSPQLPQMFNPITKDVEIRSGDLLAARCTYDSDRDETTYTGMTGDDEMCNFYIMYYTEEGELPDMQSCYADGVYKWADDLPNIPDKEASSPTSDAPSNSM
ncbi:peptidylglycine alpha-hydroxylating monooxygenase-like [Lytechinus variegatus]|uniref:peptidylglycine alpha-hydroxylating monooxygenase-like n=1 Tax=Lytechinus variegatus TaxID=7654 RepID=UPI001BB11393|nr:peptidylglycine alpha-hydroxylating monooxygenase-like [Lytechinus variegatus]